MENGSILNNDRSFKSMTEDDLISNQKGIPSLESSKVSYNLTHTLDGFALPEELVSLSGTGCNENITQGTPLQESPSSEGRTLRRS